MAANSPWKQRRARECERACERRQSLWTSEFETGVIRAQPHTRFPQTAMMDSPNNKRRRGEKKVDGNNLRAVLDSAISNKGSAELAILHLFNTYDIDLDELQNLLLGLYSSLNAS
jgi:hypothetical protein